MHAVLTSIKMLTYVVVMYRPPPSKRNGYTSDTSFKKFGDLIDSLILRRGNVIIVGDLSFHLDHDGNNSDIKRLNDMFFSAGLVQHVITPTHRSGHTLDVVISRQSKSIVSDIFIQNPLISDHSALHLGYFALELWQVERH